MSKIKHPLYIMWNGRQQRKNAFVPEWKDFYIFVKDVGEKPENTFLARKDKTKPCGPSNFYWKSIFQKLEGESVAQAKNRQMRERRNNEPNLSRTTNYKYNFGITLKQYEEMNKAQNSLCFICKNPETAKYKGTDKIKNLAIDHCHKTGKIRKLLCSKCNLFIGKLEDNYNLLHIMQNYISEHK